VVTLVLYAFLAVIVLACLYWIATRIISRAEQIAPAAADVAPWQLTDAKLDPEDVVEVRLPVAVRGYRFAETDLLLDRLTEELRLRDEQIARLQSHAAPASGAADPVAPTAASALRPEPVDDWSNADFDTGPVPSLGDTDTDPGSDAVGRPGTPSAAAATESRPPAGQMNAGPGGFGDDRWPNSGLPPQ
jgi:hypothetical protein